MGSMKELEQALRRAGRTDVSSAAGGGRRRGSPSSAAHERPAGRRLHDARLAGRPVLVAATRRGLVRISFGDHYDPDDVLPS